MSTIKILKDYVEGNMTPPDFLRALCANDDLEKALSNAPPPTFAKAHLTAYHYLLDVDLGNPLSVADARRHVQQLLSNMGVSSTTPSPGQLEGLERALRAQPKWVDLPPATLKQIADQAGPRRGRDLEAFVVEQIRKRFRYLKAPPKWLQSAEWQFSHSGEPLVFVGQLDASSLYHDETVIYVFADPASKTVKMVVQSA